MRRGRDACCISYEARRSWERFELILDKRGRMDAKE